MNHDLARDAVVDALDALLVALVALGGLRHVDVPVDALDAALHGDDAYVDAREELEDTLVEARVALGAERLELFLRLEQRANILVLASTDVAFRLGLAARGSRT